MSDYSIKIIQKAPNSTLDLGEVHFSDWNSKVEMATAPTVSTNMSTSNNTLTLSLTSMQIRQFIKKKNPKLLYVAIKGRITDKG